jgi:glycosyltransferase involved in cell wall biosynthesis
MRLLLLNEKLDFTSTSSYNLDLATSLQRLGDEVRLCITGGALRDVFREQGIETYCARLNFLSFRKLIQFLREYSPELIHVQNQRSAPFALRFSRRLGIPHVVTVHRVPAPDSPRLSHPQLAGVIAVSEVIRAALVNDQGIPKSLVRVIRHGVNLDVLKPEPSGREAPAGERRRLPVIGSIGRLAHVKGHHVLIEAARHVLNRGVEAMFMIVGDGPEEPALRQMVRGLKLEHNVTFSPHLPGLSALYRIFDIVVVPTLRGGVGATALEAMAMGKPVVASAVGEILHLIQDRRTGLLFPESDSRALADRITELARDPELARSLGAEARAHVAEEFALAPMVKATRQFYEDALPVRGERTMV